MIILYLFLSIPAFSPKWNETFTFLIQVPELALIRFVVETQQGLLSGNELLGQYTLPVLCMNKGNVLKSKVILLTCKYTSIKAALGSHQIFPSLHLHLWDMKGVLGGHMRFLLSNSRGMLFLWKVIWRCGMLGC